LNIVDSLFFIEKQVSEMEVLRSAAEIKTKEVQESKETAEILVKQVNEEKAIAEEELSAAEVILKEAEEAVKVMFMLGHIQLQ
jgi:SOS-response transcriptional repressor LexA